MVNSDKEKKGQMAVISELAVLKVKKEREIGRRINAKEIAQITGLSEHTVGRWLSPEPLQRIESAVAIAFCDYFNCDLNDLLRLRHIDQPA